MDVIFPEMAYRSMETSLQKRVRSRMDALEMNALQTAKKAGLGDSFVRDILRGKTKSPTAENVEKLAMALETTAEWLMQRNGSVQIEEKEIVAGGMEVVGFIQAGSWVDRSIMDDDGEREMIPVSRDPRFPYARQYALGVRGDSMNIKYPEGCWVTCVDFYDSGVAMKPGLIVHVERYNGPLVEMTLKMIEVIDGKMVLAPKSTNPKHLPIKLEGDGGTEIQIKGIVIGSYERTEI